MPRTTMVELWVPTLPPMPATTGMNSASAGTARSASSKPWSETATSNPPTAAVNSQGIVYLPTFIVYREIETGALIPVLRDMRARQINAYAIYPHTRHLSLRVRAFVDFLVQRFAGIPYWDNCLENQPQNHDAHSAAQDR